MSNTPSELSRLIRERWPVSLLSVLETSGAIARDLGVKLYVVGGAVRDLLLGRPNLDLDLVVEGDAVAVARRLGNRLGARAVIHSRFGTAKLYHEGSALDVITARREEYPRPGALPVIRPGNLKDDLFRRDFAINALAVRIEPGPFGELVDPYGGRQDLERRLIRILHSKSFVDDATRIFRALRYEQRLGFHLEVSTEAAMRRDIGMLDTISGDRLRHELELALKEPYPEKVLCRLDEFGALARLIPSWRPDVGMEKRLSLAREDGSQAALYLALLTYALSTPQVEEFIVRFRWPEKTARAMRDTLRVKDKLKALTGTERSSDIYRLLRDYSPTAVQANALVTGSTQAQRNLRLYLDKLRHVKVSLKGSDLMEIGVGAGPRLGELLERLLHARLDGQATTREDEVRLVRSWLSQKGIDRIP